ncbi:M20 family metallopeptidase [Isosphaeraceae bacterium EP7]
MNLGQILLGALREQRGAMLVELAALVGHESPSRDKHALDGLADSIAGRFGTLGGQIIRHVNPAGGDHIEARFEGADPRLAPSLVLAHFDTVWPTGTLARMPFRVEDGKAYGPGTYDMKASLVLLEFALKTLRDLGRAPARPVVALLTSDEEIGSASSRPLIEERARSAAHVLVLEPPLADGRLKTGRKGVGKFVVTIRGLAAHAGVEPEKGINAIQELAHQVLLLHGLADLERGTTVNVGVVAGGTVSNVVPAEATARVDVRVKTLDEADRIVRAFGSLEPLVQGIRLSVDGEFDRPPMERTQRSHELFERVREIGRTVGLELGEGSTGGASDANFTAAIGVPTLDGLGAQGAGAHADYEHVLIDALPERAALLAAVLASI